MIGKERMNSARDTAADGGGDREVRGDIRMGVRSIGVIGATMDGRSRVT